MSFTIAQLMDESGVTFGTSGARGLAEAMTDRVCYAYTIAFIQLFESLNIIDKGDEIAIAGDLRPTTSRIMLACIAAIESAGFKAINCGTLPTPAVALFGLGRSIASIMVTGSHIPEDRNGIKFYKPAGEIMKNDEADMKTQQVNLGKDQFDESGFFIGPLVMPEVDQRAWDLYKERFISFFPSNQLKGMCIGLYEHSSVTRDLLANILKELGAEVICLGRTDQFTPVDTEAIRSEDVVLAHDWAEEYQLDAIVSTDGDGDRPLISDATGEWLRGDIVGILCAQYLGANVVVTPVSSNTVVEKGRFFSQVLRTCIGSPYVISAMEQAIADGKTHVVGYEANGGFLQADSLSKNDKVLSSLPTRDACIVILSVLAMAQDQNKSIAELLKELPARFTVSGRLKNIPTALSQEKIKYFTAADPQTNLQRIESIFGALLGKIAVVDVTDGLRMTFESEEVVHLRPSGNSPELRCYNEASSVKRTQQINEACLAIVHTHFFDDEQG